MASAVTCHAVTETEWVSVAALVAAIADGRH